MIYVLVLFVFDMVTACKVEFRCRSPCGFVFKIVANKK